MKDTVVSFRGVTVEQQGNSVLSEVSFDVAKGEFLYLLGKTGSGKSSILKTMYADLPFRVGTIVISDYELAKLPQKELPYLRRKLGIVFQDFELLTDRTVEDNLLFVMKATGWKKESLMQQRMDDLLTLVGLEAYRKKYPHQLSGGEQQRVAIARALINDPVLLLADEPTGNLDPVVAQDILKLFIKINQQGTAVIMATHYHNFLKMHPSRVIFCEEGRLRDISKAQVLQRLDLGS
ncbi:cell division ATP-binding protein FtsE [Algivirga pacifica]|uniref:ATP-binding cassette domain-containing protein n=1 Tax=Algivirga pacifica TaxID=1162670 RepID=A0ABP9D806_9BACT